ncbi:uncharacterized protein LOC115230883 [Octopus sinensis]|uniref:ATP-dependent DNA helicase n=1 Tax=Octopus sinensis TaxID=2607531 RepID=A0A6P7U3K2_9MOLL|nr:uncharacterized protein LOC115230883 [Octopus sinensis]
MLHKNALNTIDTTLQDLHSNSKPFGGDVILTGDFRQALPIIPKGTPADELNACLKKSHLWRSILSRMLTINVRSILHQQDDNSFASKLLDVVNGSLPLDVNGLADISTIGNYVSGPEELCTTVYPQLLEWMCERTTLTPTNSTVQAFNICLLRQFPTQERCYTSVDSVTDPTQITFFSTEFLNPQEPSGMPLHKLCLKLGCPIMHLRNLELPRLCNGTCLAVKQMLDNVLEATIITGKGTGESAFIP